MSALFRTHQSHFATIDAAHHSAILTPHFISKYTTDMHSNLITKYATFFKTNKSNNTTILSPYYNPISATIFTAEFAAIKSAHISAIVRTNFSNIKPKFTTIG